MTEHRSFKRLVRARMEKTGESYTAARASLLTGSEKGKVTTAPTMPISEGAIPDRTGRGWEQWFDLLDEWGAQERTHKEIARWVTEEQDTDGWSAQSIAVAYERARKGRAIGQQEHGFSITASRTVAVGVERLFDAFTDERKRSHWLADGELRDCTATPPKSARYDWGDGATRVIVGFERRGDGKSTVALMHERLPDAAAAERMKSYWRERLGALKAALEGGGDDA
jgi:hypothetical protein